MLRTLLCALLLSAALAQTVVNNYQQRQVYYTEQENVCRHGSGFDWVNLLITIDGNIFNEATVKTQTFCSQWGSKDADRIKTATKWSFFDGTDYLKFDDESKPYFFEGDLVGIVLNTTLRPKAVLGNRSRTCVILGNGKILHYGGSPDFKPPTINVSCTTDET
jgi:hypothetical protein